MNWQENFTTKILERGFEYYKNGNILEILKTASGYKAELEGSGYDEYHVTIEVENDEIKEMDCTCIYGQEVGCCKHMAAVLYAIDEGRVEENLKYKLKLISSNDPCNALKCKLERIIRKYAGLTGEIDIYDLYAFSEKILNFLEQDIYEVNDKYWQSKVKCISYVLDKLNELNLDDSEEDVWIMFNTCYEMLGTILLRDANRLQWMRGMINPIYFKELMETVNV